MDTLELQNWEIGIMPEVEFKKWNEKIHQDWLELTGEKVSLDKYISQYDLDEMKKAIEVVHNFVEDMAIKQPVFRKVKTWTARF
ncbi:hypothetical protein F7R25_03910 [Burkholderia stagnalis]|uniref:Uncharacterized protein n=1 Tax=Burkholderia stagnalis TaxID=1503054 RepID=A0A6L3N3K7_9BURK|nr:hypothetical protein [Burkholderia stagnalis]KAB0640650.1 hypothetical protein F7R25_03910 [Burkholderia stagnalis]VWB06000.1 hypothetical protein BST28156_00096 [Burkholderia stagnalis]